MEMIIGGSFQGKREYALKQHPQIHWKNGAELSMAELLKCEGVIGFHEFIKKEMRENRDVSQLAEILIEQNPKLCLVSDEVGYGVVPMDAFERAYREMVGRICTKLAAKSNKVTRVVCGIGTVLKDD